MPLNNLKRIISSITSIVFIFVLISLSSVSLITEEAYAATSAFSKIEAESYSSISGSQIKIISIAGGSGLGYIDSASRAVYNSLDFGSGAIQFKAKLAASKATSIQIKSGSENGTLLGTLYVPSTGSWDSYQEMTCSISNISGINNLYLVFGGAVNIDWFTFVAVNTPTPTITPTRTSTPTPTPTLTPTPTPTIRSAFVQVQAESFNSLSSSSAQVFGISDNGTAVGYIKSGDYIVFNNLDFGTGAISFKARVAAKSATSIEIRSGSSTGNVLSTLSVASTGEWDIYQEMTCSVGSITGVKNLYLVFIGPVNFDWFMFTPVSSTSSAINAFSRIEAENNSSVSGSYIKSFGIAGGSTAIGFIQSNDYIVFNNVNFGTGAASFKANVSCASGSTTDIQIRLGSSTGTLLGTLQVPSTDSWDVYQQLTCNISNVTGTQNLYLVFTGPVNFDWFTFSPFRVTATPIPTATPTATSAPTSTTTPTTTSAPTSTTTPSTTSTPISTPSISPTTVISEPSFYLSRDSSTSAEILSTKTLPYLQSGALTFSNLGTIKGKREIVLLVDNSVSTNTFFTEIYSPMDYAIFANNNLRGVGSQADIIGDVCVNNNFESYIADLNITGTCAASTFTLGYGSQINGNTITLSTPLPMPVFHEELIQEATSKSLVFDNSDCPIEGVGYPFPGQPGFFLRRENNNTFVITGSGTFNMNSSMYFKGNLTISVPYIVNTNSNFLVADGSINLEGHDVNTAVLDQNAIDNNTNLLNVYSIHGRIFVATERSKIYGTLYAAGIPDPLYPNDCGVVLLQGINTDIYGSVIAGSDVKVEGSSSKVFYTSKTNSKIEKKYLTTTNSISIKDAAKQIIHKFAGTDAKVCALQYSDSANTNNFNLFDLSTDANVTALEGVINDFPESTNGHSNMGDGLRRAYFLLNDSSKSSPDADKYIIVLAASTPNKWTSNDSKYTSQKTTPGEADYISGDGTIDANGKALSYATTIGGTIKSSSIETIFINSSTLDISAKIEQIAAASGATQVAVGRHYYSATSLADLSTICRTVLLDVPTNAVLHNASYEEIFPEGIQVLEGPAGSVISTVQIDGVTRYKLTAALDIKLNYDGTQYIVQQPCTMNINVRPKKLGSIIFEEKYSKITYNIEYFDAYGNCKTATFVKNFNNLILNVTMAIDIN